MKTIQSTNLFLTLFCVLLITSCVPKEKKEDKENPDGDGVEMSEEDDDNAKKPSGIITLEEAKILCDNYENRRLTGIKEFERQQNPKAEFVPTQFIDFDFKTMQRYLRYVARQAKKANVSPDSLRIYLANYGADGREPNRNTVFLLPTTEINGERGGFFINANGDAELIRNYWPKTDGNGQQQPKSKASFMPSLSFFQGDGSLIMNRGHGGPPPDNDF